MNFAGCENEALEVGKISLPSFSSLFLGIRAQ